MKNRDTSETFKLVTTCGLSGTGIILAIKNLRKADNTLSKVLNIACLTVCIANTAIAVTRFISIKKTEKEIHSFNCYYNS